MEGMLGSGSDHSVLGDGNICIFREVLSLILFPEVYGQWQAWVDGFIEACDVVIDDSLANIAVSV